MSDGPEPTAEDRAVAESLLANLYPSREGEPSALAKLASALAAVRESERDRCMTVVKKIKGEQRAPEAVFVCLRIAAEILPVGSVPK